MLKRLEDGARVDIAYPADGDLRLPPGVTLGDYDGAAWTGSSLSILDSDDPRVVRQIQLARALRESGVPCFGSCWAAQLAAVAAGGRCAASPRGREFGLSRCISLSREGRHHALYRDKPAVFDGFTSHADEVVELPAAAQLLASNDWSRVQALAVGSGEAPFWAVQYHPEYDLHEVAALCRLRAAELTEQGSFESLGAAHDWANDLDALQAQPENAVLAARLGVTETLLDARLRTLEVRNWLEFGVKPRMR